MRVKARDQNQVELDDDEWDFGDSNTLLFNTQNSQQRIDGEKYAKDEPTKHHSLPLPRNVESDNLESFRNRNQSIILFVNGTVMPMIGFQEARNIIR